jgi:hypothetical protein
MPYPAPQSRQILINKLQAAWYRVDDGPWLAVDPVDGQFDAYREAITFTTDPLSTGTHTLSLKTLDNFGKMNEQEFATIATTDPAENQIETTYDQPQAEAQLTRGDLLAFHGLAKQLRGEKIVKVEYRIDGQSWQPTQAEDGQFDGSAEYFTFSIDTANFEPGTYLIQARAADSLGQVESSPASQIIIVKKQPMLYLPLVVGAP